MALFSFQTKAAAPLRVMIDPGHGGIDSGAAYGKARESDLTLKVSLLLKKLLNSNSHFKTTLTRTTDKNISLQERVALAEKDNVDLLISIHANASKDRRAKGAEFYFQSQLPPDEESLYLAATENKMAKALSENPDEDLDGQTSELSKKNEVLTIVEDLKKYHRMTASHKLSRNLLSAWSSTQKAHRGSSHLIRQAPFYVLSKTQVPAVLIELGFLTNPQESEKLMNPEYQKEIARKIYQGLVLFQSHSPVISEKN